jgi:hypothetical protein
MLRVDVILTGTGVTGGGVNQLFFGNLFADAAACVAAAQDFWDELAKQMSNGVTYRIEDSVANIDQTDGSLTSVHAVTNEPAKLGLLTGTPMSRATQGLIQWKTNSVARNRLVRGRTFIPGPTEDANFPPGVPGGTFLTNALAAANLLLNDATANFVIWNRPLMSEGEDPVLLEPGTTATVTSASIWDQWAVLRSRRD